MTLQWDKIPSVTTGGAQYFYVTWLPPSKTSDNKRIVMFNRQTRYWEVISDDIYRPDHGYEHFTFASGLKTPEAAMDHVNSHK